MKRVLDFCEKHSKMIVWSLRIIVGATFVISGVAKLIDLWGFIYKIEQYFRVWGIPDLRTIIFMISLVLSTAEFAGGLMLMTGSYRRVSVWGLGALMLLMLPLSCYLWIANPIEDCGCFGDLWVISNGATFVKNIFLTAAIAYLWVWNKRVGGYVHRGLQWLQSLLCLSYAMFIAFIGYNYQPLLDFRGYKVGESLVDTSADGGDLKFVYEKDGQRQEFDAYNLPDSSWTFVERLGQIEAESAVQNFVIMDGDEDVTADVISDSGEQLLLLIPEVDRADISYTYLINEINRYITNRGGNIIALIATNERGLHYWRDISLADYDLYSVEDTDVKEIARGHISFVYLRDGVIQWKRTLSSIDESLFTDNESDTSFDQLYFDGTRIFIIITTIHAALLLILIVFGAFIMILTRRIWRKNEKKELPLHNENPKQ
jgi:uncharacterized membrane protein